MTRIERRRRIIFDAKLYRACGRLAGDFGNHAEPKIDAGGDTARGDYIAVTHDPCLLEFRAEERQQFGVGPMRGGAPALQQPGDAEHEGAGANRGDVFGAGCLPAHEIDGLAIADRADDAFAPPGTQIRSSGGQLATLWVGNRLNPQSLGTGFPISPPQRFATAASGPAPAAVR